MLYLSFFTGPKAAAPDDIILYFNEVWMQYGGRPFTPWAAYEGGTDLTYCLGAENAVSAYACGLDFSRRTKTLMGNPTTVTIPAGSTKNLRYGTLFAPYQTNVLDNGVYCVNRDGQNALIVSRNETGGYHVFTADAEFTLLKRLAAK
jgi:hypothetical protein